jgi:serine/threonine protein kinase/Tol biopolymer transport system component
MSLAPGVRLGAYEVVAPLGAGGMGEVYRARDTRLNRDVALKVLPDSFASDPERLARFTREAQTLASLNHPHIAHIHGLEESDGVRALVMELVEGEDLSQRIARGPIPLDEALPIARQIAEALEAAHEAGIIHRDLKPANIKVRPDGTVKVLDFGLAKALDATPGSSPSVSMSPTITTPAMTHVGMILGTAAYMAPEQARGKVVDRRADIWAFGCVLYEMLTGTRAFDGDDATVVIASIIKSDLQWNLLPPDTPPAVRTVLRGCLQKDPRQRVRDMGDVRLVLEGTLDLPVVAGTTPLTVPHSTRFHRGLPWGAGLIAGSVLTGLAVWALSGSRDPEAAPVRRFALTLPDTDQLPPNSGTLVAISADGQTLIYRARRDGVFRLYRRALGQLDATPIGDTNAGSYVFFSPDGQWIGYTVGSTLKKALVSGGPSQTVCELPTLGNAAARSGSWGVDGTIVVAAQTNLLRVPAAGGTPESIVKAEAGRALSYPQILPGGRAVLFTSSEPGPDPGELEILLLDTGERRKLLPGTAGRYVPTGHLLFMRGATLWAVGFDPGRLAVVGTPVPAIEGIRVEGGGAVQFAVADDGTLVYLPGGAGSTARRLVWVNREGREEPINAPPRTYVYPRLSPDGTRVALDVRDQENDIWTWDFARSTLTRLTFDPANDQYPTWTRDGRRLIFISAREKTLAPFWQAADGTGAVERLGTDLRPLDQGSLSHDGKRLLLRAISPETREDIVMLTLDGERRIEPLVRTPFIERNVELSPDGRWMAYDSNESGAIETYVRPFPLVDGGRWQISNGGGWAPLWSPNGRELFYVDRGGSIMSAPIEAGTSFAAGNATRVMDVSAYNTGTQGRNYDISRDGLKFLMIKNQEAASSGTQINVVLSWFEELKRLVPTK